MPQDSVKSGGGGFYRSKLCVRGSALFQDGRSRRSSLQRVEESVSVKLLQVILLLTFGTCQHCPGCVSSHRIVSELVVVGLLFQALCL